MFRLQPELILLGGSPHHPDSLLHTTRTRSSWCFKGTLLTMPPCEFREACISESFRPFRNRKRPPPARPRPDLVVQCCSKVAKQGGSPTRGGYNRLCIYIYTLYIIGKTNIAEVCSYDQFGTTAGKKDKNVLYQCFKHKYREMDLGAHKITPANTLKRKTPRWASQAPIACGTDSRDAKVVPGHKLRWPMLK